MNYTFAFQSVFFVVVILAAALCQAAELDEGAEKKTEKRGIYGFGHGYHGGYYGLNGYGYGHGHGFGHPSYHGHYYPSYYGHGFYPSYGFHGHGFH